VAAQLDGLNLGFVLAALGMGGTLLTLFVLSLIADLLKRLFPEKPPEPQPAMPDPAAAKPAEPS